MNQDKNHWIALYLVGKYPGLFRTSDKLLFMDALQSISPKVFSDEKIKMFGMFGQVDEYEFYLNFLNKIERDFPERLEEFLDRLSVPNQIKDISTKQFSHTHFLKEFTKVKSITDKNEKGKALEDFLKKFFNSIEGLEVVEIKQAPDEQIDLILKNNVNRPFWIQLGSSIFLGEAKNWTSKTPSSVINTLRGKLTVHNNFSRIGFIIAMNGFAKTKENNQTRDGSGGKIIFAIDGKDIEKMLTLSTPPLNWLEDKILKAFV